MAHDMTADRRRAGVGFAFVTVALDMLAFGIVLPVLPLLISDLGGGAGDGALTFGLMQTIWAALQFTCAPLLGAISDRVGRRPVLLFSNAGLGLQWVIMALAPSLPWLFVGRIISGVASASVVTANAYVADVTPPERRAAAFGMMGAAFGLGFVLGPAFGGFLGSIDPRLPFWAAAGMNGLAFLYGVFLLPESLPKERRSAIDWSKANPAGALIFLRTKPGIGPLALVKFLSDLAHVVLPATFVLYAAHRYGWGPRDVGAMLAVTGVLSILVQAGLTGAIVKAIGARQALLLGLLSGAAAFTIYGIAPTGQWFLVGLPFGALYGLVNAAAQSLLTGAVGPQDQGKLQGALGGLQGFAGLVGPTLFTGTFAAAIAAGPAGLPGASFLLGAAILLVGAALAGRAAARIPAAA